VPVRNFGVDKWITYDMINRWALKSNFASCT
jgi:hypothetical protein